MSDVTFVLKFIRTRLLIRMFGNFENEKNYVFLPNHGVE